MLRSFLWCNLYKLSPCPRSVLFINTGHNHTLNCDHFTMTLGQPYGLAQTLVAAKNLTSAHFSVWLSGLQTSVRSILLLLFMLIVQYRDSNMFKNLSRWHHGPSWTNTPYCQWLNPYTTTRYASEVNDHDRVIELCFLCVLFCLCNIKGKLQCIFITYSELSLKHVPK